jgi:Ribonuclease G/E
MDFHLANDRVHVGSQINQAWRKFMDEIEQQSKQIRVNAEHLETLCSDRMAQLYQEKRKSRKQYQEEHAKIASQFAHVSSFERPPSDL